MKKLLITIILLMFAGMCNADLEDDHYFGLVHRNLHRRNTQTQPPVKQAVVDKVSTQTSEPANQLQSAISKLDELKNKIAECNTLIENVKQILTEKK